ncbi:hypothetical protein G6F64_015443 [Rhizopus arrhizus]|uniref:Uncharacterized protein n=2 Tax=Rhizopus TaxID=4842 RepID=A0A9P6XPG3_9FUNG|nr:hypothetical protein G6F64_015443 [Rhizopus arrhizus]KAG1529609.1 hypothetical protein G6F50_017882 [Rhizopus delemar]
MAEQLRKGMLAADAAQWQAQLKAGLPGMTRDPQRQAELGRWGESTSPRSTRRHWCWAAGPATSRWAAPRRAPGRCSRPST